MQEAGSLSERGMYLRRRRAEVWIGEAEVTAAVAFCGLVCLVSCRIVLMALAP
jgi:hypothetical protein